LNQEAPPAAAIHAASSDRLPAVVRLLGVALDAVTLEEAVQRIGAGLAAGQGGWVITPNLDILRRLVREPECARLCQMATLRLADGMPLVWASRLQGTPLPARVAGSDLIWSLCRWAAADGRSVFLLGGNPGTAEAAAVQLAARSPALRVAGTECPAMGFERDEAYLSSLKSRLVSLQPDIVFVGLGFPKQERLIEELRGVLPRAWFLGIGVTFSFVSGEIRRAPRWMRSPGLEWIHRLMQEPGRLAKRYLVHGVPFGVVLVAGSLVQRARGTGRPASGGIKGTSDRCP
jgi:N-acetylglucosaminyldiphosphoundecaprenol N-acetyl-beta-D-mannosaminyltransferase